MQAEYINVSNRVRGGFYMYNKGGLPMKIKRAICLLMTALFVMAMTPAMAAACTHSAPAADSDCIVCKVAAMINALPAKDDITIDNAAAVTDRIHAIDRVKVEIETDEEYEALLKLVNTTDNGSIAGYDVPRRYVDAVDKVSQLTGGGSLYIQKKFVAADGTAVNALDAQVQFKLTNVDTKASQLLTMTTLDYQQNSLGTVPGFYSASTNNDGWTYKYLLPAGTYTIEEISDSGAKVDGKPFVTGSTTYELNGEELAKGTQIEVKAGESHTVVVYNSLEPDGGSSEPTPDSTPTFTFPNENKTITLNAGDSTTLTVAATYATSYQWYVVYNKAPADQAINGAISESYTIPPVTSDNDGDIYYCIATNANGKKISPTFTLQINSSGSSDEGTTPGGTTSPSGYSGPSLWYIGGNTFGTSTTKAPTKVEIDGAAVPFTMDGSKIIVSCINADAGWVTARWGSTTNTVNFTPDAAAYCTQVSIPKTGDMPLWAAIAAFLGF